MSYAHEVIHRNRCEAAIIHAERRRHEAEARRVAKVEGERQRRHRHGQWSRWMKERFA